MKKIIPISIIVTLLILEIALGGCIGFISAFTDTQWACGKYEWDKGQGKVTGIESQNVCYDPKNPDDTAALTALKEGAAKWAWAPGLNWWMSDLLGQLNSLPSDKPALAKFTCNRSCILFLCTFDVPPNISVTNCETGKKCADNANNLRGFKYLVDNGGGLQLKTIMNQARLQPGGNCVGYCGNNVAETKDKLDAGSYDEQCDGTDLGGKTCATAPGVPQGLTDGNLGCVAPGQRGECTFNVSACAQGVPATNSCLTAGLCKAACDTTTEDQNTDSNVCTSPQICCVAKANPDCPCNATTLAEKDCGDFATNKVNKKDTQGNNLPIRCTTDCQNVDVNTNCTYCGNGVCDLDGFSGQPETKANCPADCSGSEY